MSEADKTFAGSIPAIYDELLVPLIFAGYADDMAQRVTEYPVAEVLEIAAGTGVLTRALAARLPATARYVVTDLNQPMLDRARASQDSDGRLVWQQADALALPLPDAAFDAVCCQFGAMFFPDRVRGFAEARRVLRPGGRLHLSVWDRIEENDLPLAVQEAVGELIPSDPPRFMERMPHGYHDIGRMRSDLQQAGFADIRITPRDDISRAHSATHVAIAFCQGTPLRNEIEARCPGRLEEITEAVTAALVRKLGKGELSGRIRAFIVQAA